MLHIYYHAKTNIKGNCRAPDTPELDSSVHQAYTMRHPTPEHNIIVEKDGANQQTILDF